MVIHLETHLKIQCFFIRFRIKNVNHILKSPANSLRIKLISTSHCACASSQPRLATRWAIEPSLL